MTSPHLRFWEVPPDLVGSVAAFYRLMPVGIEKMYAALGNAEDPGAMPREVMIVDSNDAPILDQQGPDTKIGVFRWLVTEGLIRTDGGLKHTLQAANEKLSSMYRSVDQLRIGLTEPSPRQIETIEAMTLDLLAAMQTKQQTMFFAGAGWINAETALPPSSKRADNPRYHGCRLITELSRMIENDQSVGQIPGITVLAEGVVFVAYNNSFVSYTVDPARLEPAPSEDAVAPSV